MSCRRRDLERERGVRQRGVLRRRRDTPPSVPVHDERAQAQSCWREPIMAFAGGEVLARASDGPGHGARSVTEGTLLLHQVVRSWLTVRTTFPVFCPISTYLCAATTSSSG